MKKRILGLLLALCLWGGLIFDFAAYANVTAGQNLRYYGAMELTEANRRTAMAEVQELARSLREHA